MIHPCCFRVVNTDEEGVGSAGVGSGGVGVGAGHRTLDCEWSDLEEEGLGGRGYSVNALNLASEGLLYNKTECTASR